jgi:hypothetical protein
MVLTDCEIIEAECIFLLIDNGIVSSEICHEFMTSVYHKNYEMFALLNWMLMRWVLLRKHKFHLPARRTKPQGITLANLIHSNST